MRMRSLGIALSKLERKKNLDPLLEQYITSGELASRWLYDIMAFGDISVGCKIVDLGAGNGNLGIGASLLGAGFVTFIEADKEMCEVASKNAKTTLQDGTYDIVNIEIGKENPGGAGWPQSGTRWCIAEDDLKEHYYGKVTTGNQRQSYKRARDGLLKKGEMSINEGFLWLTRNKHKIGGV